MAQARLERDLAGAALDGDARDRAVAEERAARAVEPLGHRTRHPVAASAALCADDRLDVAPQRGERAQSLVLVAGNALFEDRVLLDGDAHEADDHVRPVRRLAATAPRLRLAQLLDQRAHRWQLRESLQSLARTLEPLRAHARVLRQVAEADDQLDARLRVRMAEREVAHPRAVGRDAVADAAREDERAHRG